MRKEHLFLGLLLLIPACCADACSKTSLAIDKGLDAVKKARADGDDAAAERLLEPILKSDPDNIRALYSLGLMQIGRRDMGAAEVSLWRAAKLDHECEVSHDYAIYNTLGWVQASRGKAAEAEANYAKAIEGFDPTNPQAAAQARSNLGSLLFAQGRFDDAKSVLAQASAAGSKSAARTLEQLSTAQTQFDQAVAPRVFVHVTDDVPKTTSNAILDMLKNSHYSVPELQVVKAAPKNDEIRYFHEGDKPIAEKLAKQLAGANVGTFNVKEFDPKTPTFTVPDKQLEVWVSHGQ